MRRLLVSRRNVSEAAPQKEPPERERTMVKPFEMGSELILQTLRPNHSTRPTMLIERRSRPCQLG